MAVAACGGASNPEPTAAPTATAVPTDTPPPTAQRQPPKLCCICLLWPGFAQFCPTSWSSSGVRSDISAGRNPTVSITHCFSATDFSCSDADWRLLLEHYSSINALWSSVRSFKLSGAKPMVEIMHCLLLLKAASSPCWPADAVDIDAAHMSRKATSKMNTADNGLLAFARIANSGEFIARFINLSY